MTEPMGRETQPDDAVDGIGPTSRTETKAKPLARRLAVMLAVLITAAVALVLVGWFAGWFATPLQEDRDEAWGYTSESESQSTDVVGWFLPSPSSAITLDDAWAAGSEDVELLSVRAVQTSDDLPEIGSTSVDDPTLEERVVRPLTGTVLEPARRDQPPEWYVLFELRWTPEGPDDFDIVGPMHLSYDAGLRRLHFRECGFVVYHTPRSAQAAQQAADAAHQECLER